MSHSLSDLLLLYAQQFEDQHAPQNMTIALREAAKELDRLQAGGCARDQSTTQYCAEAARLAVESEQNRIDLEEYRRDVERLTAALRGAYEVFAGSDGFIPETAAEGYQQQIIKQMVDCISAALKEDRT
jgi:hypothetical protein